MCKEKIMRLKLVMLTLIVMLAIGFLLSFAVNVQPKSDYDKRYKFPRYGQVTNYEHDGYKFIIFHFQKSFYIH